LVKVLADVRRHEVELSLVHRTYDWRDVCGVDSFQSSDLTLKAVEALLPSLTIGWVVVKLLEHPSIGASFQVAYEISGALPTFVEHPVHLPATVEDVTTFSVGHRCEGNDPNIPPGVFSVRFASRRP
jgi:hypothetical protein